VDAMGSPCDDKGEIRADGARPVFGPSPLIIERAPVDRYLHTGTKMVDAMVPIGKGQRQLIMGDRLTGKTVVALDAILSQRGQNVLCIYCCIGKAVSALEKVVTLLSEKGALEYTTVVAATDSATPGEQYIVPFSAATLGEDFMRHGRDVLVVFDDLTKHAWAYRQLSLLLERPPGREAYPGDIFYVETQLLERAGRLNQTSGGGSMTFLCIADTLQGDLTGYIPSNLISISDGLVYLSTSLFGEGIRPAVDMSLSMSIVGGKAQPPVLRELCDTLRGDYHRYTELLRLSRLQSGLSKEAERVLKRGQAIVTLLQQPPYKPVGLAEEVLLLYALRSGLLDDLSAEAIGKFERDIPAFAKSKNEAALNEIEAKGQWTPMIARQVKDVLDKYFAATSA
jgi:F-type H+/Na+-transporting ATPase subunit alpha